MGLSPVFRISLRAPTMASRRRRDCVRQSTSHCTSECTGQGIAHWVLNCVGKCVVDCAANCVAHCVLNCTRRCATDCARSCSRHCSRKRPRHCSRHFPGKSSCDSRSQCTPNRVGDCGSPDGLRAVPPAAELWSGSGAPLHIDDDVCSEAHPGTSRLSGRLIARQKADRESGEP